MKKYQILTLSLALIITVTVALTLLQPANAENRKNLPSSEKVKLPEPNLKSNISIEETLLNRRSVRGFSDLPMTLKQVSQLLWAGQGITNARPTNRKEILEVIKCIAPYSPSTETLQTNNFNNYLKSIDTKNSVGQLATN